MEVNVNKSLKELQEQLYDAKNHLTVLNDSIRRIVGRPVGIEVGHGSLNGAFPKYGSVQRQKPTKSVFTRLSISHDETKLSLGSRIVRDMPSRQEVLEAQGLDMESIARNRRMFGSLLGTLHKFCLEESRLKQKEDKKAQIERKLEEQQCLEREMIRKERDLLLLDQKKRLIAINNLELKIDRLKDFAVLERSITNYRCCIRTKTKPFIYYKPYKFSKKTEKLMSYTNDTLDTEIRNRKLTLTHELKVMDLQEQTPQESIHNQYKAESLVLKGNKVRKQNGFRKKTDSKENKSRNLMEPSLSSSIVVVKRS
ncbi:pinin [Eurosta solidaginis]|uniref:pinin n=1 Tax=Eurosta solidaginis TaxID=178769 RepID=UPI003530A8CF